MHIIHKDPMTYKTYLKNDEIINIKLRIIKHKLIDNESIKTIAYRYSMHRNSVRNIMNTYINTAPIEFKNKITISILFLMSTFLSFAQNKFHNKDIYLNEYLHSLNSYLKLCTFI